jgi:FMN phosphatase YigB (HAD superfamily)
MAGKSLLLDIDGVLIRDRQLLNHVRDNCVRYVRNKVPACKQPNRLNGMLVSARGHTARGLRDSFGIDTSDFNDSVYDVPVRTRLWDLLSSTEFQKEAAEIHKFTQTGWKVTLFTNAPMKWAGEVAHAISSEVYVQCPDDLLHSPLKPEPEAYNFPKHHTHIFVDDSMRNLHAAKRLPNWKPIHFNEHKTKSGYVTRTFPTIGSIWELSLFISTVDLEINRS